MRLVAAADSRCIKIVLLLIELDTVYFLTTIYADKDKFISWSTKDKSMMMIEFLAVNAANQISGGLTCIVLRF
jgi:hypothetical protein